MKPIKIKRKTSKNPLKQPLLWAALALTPATVYAECTQDSDCAEGQICDNAPISSAECFIDENGEEICTGEELNETIGYCTDAPINCVQDSDCPSHLRCEGGGGMTSSPGDPGALPPPPNPDEDDDGFAPDSDEDQIEEETEDAPAMCVYIQAECETDSDCGENFHCETYTYAVDCVMPISAECEEGEDCPPVEESEFDCGEEEFSEGFCEPNEIECDSDDACPADWRCREMTEVICDGEDDDISVEGDPREDSGSFADNAEPEDESPTVTVECQELSRDVCVPVGLDYVEISGGEVTDPTISTDPDGEINDGDGSGSTPGTDGDGDDDNDNDDNDDDDNDDNVPSENSGGDVEESSCSASSRGASPWTLFGLLALLGFRRRIAAS